MSANGSADGSAEGESWKLTLPCTRAEARMLAGEVPALAALDQPPVVMTREPDESRPNEWLLEAYFDGEPAADLVRLLHDLVPSAAAVAPAVERLDAADWVTISQAGLEPIAAGRFFVHTAAHADAVPAGTVAFRIEAGRAFGTGQHQTTAGCLEMLDTLRLRGRRFSDIADIGTGTGLLAFAAMHLWPHARTIASDIDPVSIEVTGENALLNGVPLGRGPGRLALAVAPGLEDRAILSRAPFDLVIANILAAPLIELAPVIAQATLPGGTVILAGLLDTQADTVIAAYRRVGFAPVGRITRGDWPTLCLRRRPSARATRPLDRLQLPPTVW